MCSLPLLCWFALIAWGSVITFYVLLLRTARKRLWFIRLHMNGGYRVFNKHPQQTKFVSYFTPLKKIYIRKILSIVSYSSQTSCLHQIILIETLRIISPSSLGCTIPEGKSTLISLNTCYTDYTLAWLFFFFIHSTCSVSPISFDPWLGPGNLKNSHLLGFACFYFFPPYSIPSNQINLLLKEYSNVI